MYGSVFMYHNSRRRVMDHVARDEKNKNSQKQKKDSRKESQKEIKWRVENKISMPNLFINILASNK